MSDSLLCTEDGIRQVQEALAAQELDGWLLYEFRGANPIAAAMLEPGHTTRRGFFLIPAGGRAAGADPRHRGLGVAALALGQAHVLGVAQMEEELAALLEGGAVLAMEVSPGAAVPTLDYLPAGMAEVLLRSGVEAASSGDLVSRFYSVWTEQQLADHMEAVRDPPGGGAAGVRDGPPPPSGPGSRPTRARSPTGSARS